MSIDDAVKAILAKVDETTNPDEMDQASYKDVLEQVVDDLNGRLDSVTIELENADLDEE